MFESFPRPTKYFSMADMSWLLKTSFANDLTRALFVDKDIWNTSMSTGNLSLVILKVYICDNNVLSNRNVIYMIQKVICRSISNRLSKDYHQSQDHSANLKGINIKAISSLSAASFRYNNMATYSRYIKFVWKSRSILTSLLGFNLQTYAYISRR